MYVKTAMTPEELQDVYHIRKKVFIEEQNVPPELEMDTFDSSAVHFIAYDENEPVAAARLRMTENGEGKLERICVLKEHRGKSIGKKVMQKMEQEIVQQGLHQAKLNAQTHAQAFYQKQGYEAVSGEFMDAGIPHVTMIKNV